MSITKLSHNWACQMGPIHLINFLLSGYAVILAIGCEENSVAFYLKSETDSFCFRLSIWNSITKNIQIIMLLPWQKHNIIEIIYAKLNGNIIYYCNENNAI